METKILVGKDAGAYSFDASAQQVTITGLGLLALESLLLITNVTSGEKIYQFNDASLGGTIAGPEGTQVVTLTFDTTTMADTDRLQIWVIDPKSVQTLTKKTVTASSSGANTIHTPALGKKVRLYYLGYSAGATVTGVLVGMRFTAGGTDFDNQYLVTPGQPFGRNIQAGKRYIDGGVNEALVVNLSAAQTVYVNVELEEI